MAKNFRSTREFREAMLEALGTTQDKDVENEANYKSALLEALGVEHTRSDVVNFETFREKLVEGVTNYSGGSGGGGSSDFSTATLSIVDDGGHNVNLDVATLNERRGFSSGGYPNFNASEDLPVILYKGTAILELENLDNANISISGDIENVGDNNYVITGDCTITIS